MVNCPAGRSHQMTVHCGHKHHYTNKCPTFKGIYIAFLLHIENPFELDNVHMLNSVQLSPCDWLNSGGYSHICASTASFLILRYDYKCLK